MDEVIYEEGNPTEVATIAPTDSPYVPGSQKEEIFEVPNLPVGKQPSDYTVWVFSHETHSLKVEFGAKSRRVVSIACYPYLDSSCPPLLGVSVGTTEEAMESLLGRPSDTKVSEGWKTARYSQLNAVFFLAKRIVNCISIRRFEEEKR
ncbi:MAG TPA: hypothetical protein VMR31_19010 [Myxococcota bacterium]|nr:hypothetical protein [Myxococcota bacterium]